MVDFGLEDVVPTDAVLRLASKRLDSLGPFWGGKYGYPQALAFPRTYVMEGDALGVVPEAILDWVALEAYKVAVATTDGEEAPITSMSLPDGGSVTYARPVVGTPASLQRGLLDPYLLTHGELA